MSQHSPAKYEPDYVFAPGDTLAEILSDLEMKQAELARRTGLSVKLINQIVQGSASISADTALKLERVLGVPAVFWSGLEARYQVFRAEAEQKAKLGSQADWLSTMPVKELQSRGYIDRTADKPLLVQQLLRFFRVATPNAWSEVWALPTAYRKSQAYEPDYASLAAWIRIGELRAEGMQLPPYDRTRFRDSLEHIRQLTKETDPNRMIEELTKICRASGVALVVEKEIKGARINGLVRWLRSGNPILMLSLRYRWADIFWFTFFHEAGHLLIHDRKRATFIDIPNQKTNDSGLPDPSSSSKLMEAEADDFSGRILLPRAIEPKLGLARDAASVEAIATEAGVHPGIVVGRLQHDGVIHYSQLNGLRIRFKFADD